MQKTLIVIPTYNEATNIAFLMEKIHQIVKEAHILVVDDNSPDGTAQIVQQCQKKNSHSIFLLQRTAKNGLGKAYLAGFAWALTHDYENIIQMDADFSHDPKVLLLFLHSLKHYDFVIGSRYVQGGGTENWSLFRKCISKFGSFYARFILQVPIRDFTGGFNAWKRKVLKQLSLGDIQSQGYSFQIELKYKAYSAGFQYVEVPIRFQERLSGQSKMSFKIVWEAIRAVWSLRFTQSKIALPLKSD